MIERAAMLRRVAEAAAPWDIVIVGGGATGLGAAVDAAARGYSTLLLERDDFACGTSSRSTKLVHGGVRYLRTGDVGLVLEALRERGLLMRNAPHLVRNLSFVVPAYVWWESPFYGAGLKLYDLLAGEMGLGPSRRLSVEETIRAIPTLERDGLRGGVVYHDGQFDDSRLAITLLLTLADRGGAAINRMPVEGLLRARGRVAGVAARDAESGRAFEIPARVVINATGVFCDAVRRLDEPGAAALVSPSQGAHIVLDRSFQPGSSAILVPQTDDGRVLFAVPWHDRVVVGTTDTPVDEATHDPRPLEEEIDFLLAHAGRYLTRDPTRADILSCFAGLRPLVRADGAASTAALSRDHTIVVSPSGLVSITGGKWTTYRLMGEDVVNRAAEAAGLEMRASVTKALALRGGAGRKMRRPEPWDVYGSDATALRALAKEAPALAEPIHPRLPYVMAQVVWAARAEMARTVEDVLARRTRALLLDARASIEAAPRVATALAQALGHDAAWAEREAAAYVGVAAGYLPAIPRPASPGSARPVRS
ncbi:MAG TPA: glycerol-3-phosphate dehydrogenase/oxidase [Dongiaceae bacterium]|nr:glycerol-3-phosphate dehydrogenase/oxidase [Dongiaceae bacterium]